jgi:glycosyltransferase involved in cell wall biosynthesis
LNKGILITNNHPELRNLLKEPMIANQISTFSGNYILSEATLKLFKPVLSKKFYYKLMSRSIYKAKSIKYVRSGILYEILSKIAIKIGFRTVENRFRGLSDKALSDKSNEQLKSGQFGFILTNNFIQLKKPEKVKLITVSPLGYSKSNYYWEQLARDEWVDWPEIFQHKEPKFDQMIDQSDIVIALSNFAAKGILRHTSETMKVITAHPGIPNWPIVSGPKEELLKIRRNEIVYIGRMIREKGLLSILALENQIDSKWSIKLIGPSNSEFDIYLPRLNQHPFVEYIGPLSRIEVQRELIEASILLLPSYCEGFGLVILEAMSMGVIPIASFNSAAPEIFSGTILENLLIRPGNVSEMTAKISWLDGLSSGELRFIREACIQRAKDFNWKNFNTKIVEGLQKFEII